MREKSSSADCELPNQFADLLKRIRVFGHFETDLLLDLWRHVTVVQVETNGVLFQPGHIDDSIYVVLRGQLAIYIKSTTNKKFLVKTVNEGDSVFSMLSILDVLTRHPDKFKTVSASALVPSTILKLWAPAFRDVFEKYPESWLRAVQLIALNLQHVTFDTLHSLLGLTKELLKVKIIDNIEGQLEQREIIRKQELNDYDRMISMDLAAASFSRLFGLEDEEMLVRSKVQVESYPAGFVLTEEGSTDNSLFYIILGSVDMLQKAVDDDKVVIVSRAFTDEVVGNLAILTGEPSFYTFRTHRDTMIAMIKKEDLYSLMQLKPRIVLNLAHQLMRRISAFVRQIDFVLQYETLDPGKELYKQNDKPDAIFRVLSGRLRSEMIKNDNSKEIMEEFSRSDVVGLIELLTERPRASTVISVRSTEIAKVPEGLLNMITEKYPQANKSANDFQIEEEQNVPWLALFKGESRLGILLTFPVLTRLIKLLGNFMFRQKEQMLTAAGKMEPLRHVANLNTIAAFPVSPDIPLLYFTLELWRALNSIKPTLRLSSDVVKKSLGDAAVEKVNAFRFMSWLNQQEDAYPLVLYQCDFTLNEWTKRCVYQADCILIVANGRNSSNIEQELHKLSSVSAQKELVLLWPSSVKCPYKTIEWLSVRSWISTHYHIRIPHWAYSFNSAQHLLLKYEKDFAKPMDKFSDFSRLARILIGCSIGLVLGGGGARGAAHVGVLRALSEAGIPIDMVGGVSIGSLVGGIYCICNNIKKVDEMVEQWFKVMSSTWNRIKDLTIPVLSFFSGGGFNQTLKEIFHDKHIEDLWITYFNVTSDISASEMRVHRKGELWRYVRASMSYCGVFPPMCDSVDNHYLVDGCYVNNLPADVMRSIGAATVFAIDIGAQDKCDLDNIGDSVSGLWLLWKKLPLSQPVKILNMAEIQSRLAYVSCVRQLELVKCASYCRYLRPSIDKYDTLDFALFEEIRKLGYECAKNYCDNLIKTGQLEKLTNQTDWQDGNSRQTQIKPETTFTDLASVVTTTLKHYRRPNATDEENRSSEFEDQFLTEPSLILKRAAEPINNIEQNK